MVSGCHIGLRRFWQCRIRQANFQVLVQRTVYGGGRSLVRHDIKRAKLLRGWGISVRRCPKASFNLAPFCLGRPSSSSSSENDCNSPCCKAEIQHRERESQRLRTWAEPHREYVHGHRHKVRDSPCVHGPNCHLTLIESYWALGFVTDLTKTGLIRDGKQRSNILAWKDIYALFLLSHQLIIFLFEIFYNISFIHHCIPWLRFHSLYNWFQVLVGDRISMATNFFSIWKLLVR